MPSPVLLRPPVRCGLRAESGGRTGSREWLDVPIVLAPAARAELLRRLDLAYPSWIGRIMGLLAQARVEPDGHVRARVKPLGWPVGLDLSPPVVSEDRVARAVLGGWLVSEPGGELAVEARPIPGGTQLAVDLTGFAPRLCDFGHPGRWFYELAQQVLHVRLSRGFLLREAAPLARALGTR